jgi:hypothetical protein
MLKYNMEKEIIVTVLAEKVLVVDKSTSNFVLSQEIIEWFRNNINGKSFWMVYSYNNIFLIDFEFDNKDDAMLFKLTWV